MIARKHLEPSVDNLTETCGTEERVKYLGMVARSWQFKIQGTRLRYGNKPISNQPDESQTDTMSFWS